MTQQENDPTKSAHVQYQVKEVVEPRQRIEFSNYVYVGHDYEMFYLDFHTVDINSAIRVVKDGQEESVASTVARVVVTRSVATKLVELLTVSLNAKSPAEDVE